MLRALRPDLRIGFFLHIPLPAAGAVHAAAVAPADRRGHARRRPRRLPAPGRGAELPADLPRGSSTSTPTRTTDPVRRAHRAGRARSRSRSTSPSSTAIARAARDGRARPPRSARGARLAAPDPPRRRPARLHEGHRRPPAGLPRAARERRHDTPARPCSCRSRRRAASASTTYRQLRERVERAVGPDQRRVRAPRPPRDPLPAPQPAARGPRARSTRLPT